jgi:hypothetical protein
MERCKDCRHWKQKALTRENFGECWSGKFACYEDVLCNISTEDKHLICDGNRIETNKDFGCIDFESKAWSLK